MLQEANAASASASQTETQPVVQGEVDDQNCTDGDGENVEGEEDDDEEDDHAPIPRLPNPRGGVAPPPTGKPPFPAQRIADLRKRRHEEQFGTESEDEEAIVSQVQKQKQKKPVSDDVFNDGETSSSSKKKKKDKRTEVEPKKKSTAELSQYLFPCLVARLGFDGPSSVMSNEIKKEMISWICSKKPSLEIKLEDIDFARLNDSYGKHMLSIRRNAQRCVEKVLLDDNNPAMDPMLSWVLVIPRAMQYIDCAPRTHTHDFTHAGEPGSGSGRTSGLKGSLGRTGRLPRGTQDQHCAHRQAFAPFHRCGHRREPRRL